MAFIYSLTKLTVLFLCQNSDTAKEILVNKNISQISNSLNAIRMEILKKVSRSGPI